MVINKIAVSVFDMITFIGMAITLFTSVLNLLENRKSLYITNVTYYRLKSIEELKKYISELKELSNITNLYIRCNSIQNKMEFRSKIDKNNLLIKFNLNFTKAIDSIFISKIDSVRFIIINYMSFMFIKNDIYNIEDKNNIEIINKVFIDDLYKVTDKYTLIEIIKHLDSNFKFSDSVDKYDRLSLVETIKNICKEDENIVLELYKEINTILLSYEEQLEYLHIEIEELAQIYFKLEWSHYKKDINLWPFNKYNERKKINSLINRYEKVKKRDFF